MEGLDAAIVRVSTGEAQDSLSGNAATVRWTAYGGEGADGVPAQVVVVSDTLYSLVLLRVCDIPCV